MQYGVKASRRYARYAAYQPPPSSTTPLPPSLVPFPHPVFVLAVAIASVKYLRVWQTHKDGDRSTAKMRRAYIEMKKKSKGKKIVEKESPVVVQIPIPNLPEKFLWMHVNSGTKIRNVINYALKEFPGYKSVVWSGAGHGIGKVITCVEICKRKHPGLHQITKLRYIKSKTAKEKSDSDTETRNVPEIHVLLAKDPLDEKEPGHQSIVDETAMFSTRRLQQRNSNNSFDKNSDNTGERESKLKPTTSKLSNVATAEFAAMGLRTGQKRSHKGQQAAETSSGNKSRKKRQN